MKTNTQHIPFKATHPGTLLKDEIDARNINQIDFARDIDVHKTVLNEIIKGKRSITADFAILLETVLDIPADYWLNFQNQYDLDVARIKERNIQKLYHIKIWKIIKEHVPVSYFKKTGYLVDNLIADITKIKEIYCINSIDELVNLTAIQKYSLFRKSEKLAINENNVLAWNVLAKYEAGKQKVPEFNFDSTPSLINELNAIFYKNSNTVDLVYKKLNDYGIKFILVQKLNQTPIDGYTFWSGNNPVIALTLRHARIDNFAFTIMHEIGHIYLHLKESKEKYFFDIKKNETAINPIEEEANVFAQTSLIPSQVWSEINNCKLKYSDEEIIKFSKLYKIHPAIILGRISFVSSNYAVKTLIDKKLN